MTWDKIWGHETAISALQRAIAREHCPPSVLLSGPASIGKSLLAMQFACALVCANAGAPCGVCSPCRAVQKQRHPDVQRIEPTGATSTIAVELIRQALHRLHQTPVQGTRQVLLLIDVDRLKAEAANTLLKTLEEPPRSAHLVLTTSDVGRCLPTIVSRCQIIRMHPWTREALAQQLHAIHQLDVTRAQHIAARAEGRVGRALQLMQAKTALTMHDVLTALEHEKRWIGSKREQLMPLLEHYLWWCRDQMCRVAGCAELATTSDQEGSLPHDAQHMASMTAMVAEAVQHLEALQQHVNPKLLLWSLQQRWLSPASTERETLNAERARL